MAVCGLQHQGIVMLSPRIVRYSRFHAEHACTGSLRSDSGGSQELPAVAMPVYSCNAHTVAEQLIVGVE